MRFSRVRSKKRVGVIVLLFAFLASGLTVYTQCHSSTPTERASISHQHHTQTQDGAANLVSGNSVLMDSCIGLSIFALLLTRSYFAKKKFQSQLAQRIKIFYIHQSRNLSFTFNAVNPFNTFGVMRI